MIEDGRMVCTARNPRCDRCVLNRICPSAYRFPNFGKRKVPVAA